MAEYDLDLVGASNPGTLQQKFLNALLKLQNVHRGSIWIKQDEAYVCVEAAGRDSENIKGVRLGLDHPSIVGWVIENKEMTVSETKSDRRHYREVEDGFSVKSSQILCFPLFQGQGEVYGAVQIIDTAPDKGHLNLDRAYLEQLQHLVDICSMALSNAILYARERDRNKRLSSALSRIRSTDPIIGQSPSFRKSLALIDSYSATDFHVLITGDSGTGKELMAERLHSLSHRAGKPFLVQNCSAIPETLLESELFGYTKGAFTGAVRDKVGLFEAADGGTVFLDEIGDMPLNTQAGLLRVLQKNEIKPVGSAVVKHVDVRVVAATHRDIKQMIAENRFRQDLYYRLSVLPVHLPTLGDRQEDIPLLARHFMEKEAAKIGLSPGMILPETMACLCAYGWPGNIRELENLVRYLLVTASEGMIQPGDLPIHIRRPGSAVSEVEAAVPEAGTGVGLDTALGRMRWDELEKTYALALLDRCRWNITRAAQEAGVNRSTFASRLRKMGIRKQEIS